MEFNFNGPSGPLRIALAIIVGLGAVGYGGFMYTAQSSALDATETVNATIESTSIERLEQTKGTDDYSPQATFNYTYQGESYTSSAMFPGDVAHELETKEDARAQLEGYEPGATVAAYVPSDSPENAFLKHESSNKPIFVMALGGILVVGTIISIFRG